MYALVINTAQNPVVLLIACWLLSITAASLFGVMSWPHLARAYEKGTGCVSMYGYCRSCVSEYETLMRHAGKLKSILMRTRS